MRAAVIYYLPQRSRKIMACVCVYVCLAKGRRCRAHLACLVADYSLSDSLYLYLYISRYYTDKYSSTNVGGTSVWCENCLISAAFSWLVCSGEPWLPFRYIVPALIYKYAYRCVYIPSIYVSIDQARVRGLIVHRHARTYTWAELIMHACAELCLHGRAAGPTNARDDPSEQEGRGPELTCMMHARHGVRCTCTWAKRSPASFRVFSPVYGPYKAFRTFGSQLMG
jgi:hypothetical protein